ncbi:DMT family transporter [Streptomyces sp. NPDC006372]|uniref:DMT family transporter n=1 Tax=Streptomyces sp. NPDC006372 TaxID=3155599 RepID=UPI0033AE4117
MNVPVAVALALASVTAYATGATMQHRVASADPARAGLRSLLTKGAWWASNAANALGAALHVAALKYGPLTLVQCLGALTVVAAVPLGARGAGRRVSRTEWRGVSLTLLGFALVTTTTTGAGSAGVLDASSAVAVAVPAALIVPLALAVRTGSPRTLTLAAASGIASGTGSALTQTVLHSGRPVSWQTALIALPAIVLALVGLLLSQFAYTGGLGAPLATLTLANPMTAAVIGLTLLGERINGGLPGALLAVAGAALAGRGVLLLARCAETHAVDAHPAAFPTANGSADAVLAPTAPAPRPPTAGHIPYPHIAVTPESEGRTP